MKHFYSVKIRITVLFLSLAIVIASVVFPAYSFDYYDTSESGVISNSLKKLMNKNPNERFKVIIWLDDVNYEQAIDQAFKCIPNYREKFEKLKTSRTNSKEEADEWQYYISVRRDALRSCYETYSCSFASNYLKSDELIYSSAYLPVVIANLYRERINVIASTRGVASIDVYCDDIIEEQPVSANRDSDLPPDYYQMWENIEYINADGFEDEWGTNGYGVRIGILDEGKPDLSLSMFTGGDITVHYSSATIEDHATNVLKIAYRTAFDASFYCTSYSYTGVSSVNLLSELDWLVGCYVDVINISLRVRDEAGGSYDSHNTYGAISQILDRYITLYDVSIVKSAGNDGASGITSGGMAYNVITVGNYYRYGNTIDSISSYNNGTDLELADKPDVCAPGYVLFDDMSYGFGTSYSAPLVTGVIALLMACRGTFRVQPERVKAVLTASVTMNTHHYLPDTSNYHLYGAGVIDAARASDIALNMDYSDDSMAYNASYVVFEETFYSSTPVRIALAFEKYISTSNVVYSLADLDLSILDSNNNLVASSATSFNNVEIVEFTPSNYGIFTIKIKNYTPAYYYSSYHSTDYSISWIQE